MNLFHSFQRRSLADLARREAVLDVDSGEDHVIAALGPRPVFDPVGNEEHARLAFDLSRVAEIDEWRGDLRQQEDLRTGQTSLIGAALGLLALYMIEALGCVLILRALGFVNPERLLFGFGLAALILSLTTAVAQRPRWWSILVYLVLVAAVGTVRVREMSAGEDGSTAESVAGGVLLLAVSIGPAFLAEVIARRFAPAIKAAREIGKLRGRIRAAERARRRAQARIEDLARAGVAWDGEAERRRRVYRATQRLTQAEVRQAEEKQLRTAAALIHPVSPRTTRPRSGR